MEESPVKEQFKAMARASTISSIEQKHVQYISMADRRAQGLLTITSFLIPISITRIQSQECQYAVLLYLASAMVTVVAAILCLAPKKYNMASEDPYLLHFSGISQL